MAIAGCRSALRFSLTGGGTQNFGGAIYLPQAALSFSAARHDDVVHEGDRGYPHVYRQFECQGRLLRVLVQVRSATTLATR